MRIQQKVASYEKIGKWKTSLIGQANGSKQGVNHKFWEDDVSEELGKIRT